MNKDQVKGAAKDIAGKIQEGAGELTGDREQEAKGLAKQVEGKTQKKVGDAKETVKDAIDDFKSRTVIPSNPLRRVFLGVKKVFSRFGWDLGRFFDYIAPN